MRRRPPPNYLSRAVQRRLLVLVGMLLGVLLLMQEAGRPERWTWMWKITGHQPPTSQASQTPASRPLAVGSSSPQQGSTLAIDPEQLARVKDDTYFRPEESAAWFHVWNALQNTTDVELASASQGEVSFLQIDQQIGVYRGKIVELRGTVRRAHSVTAPNNELGLEHYWQCWLFLDHGPRKPIVVYCLNRPDGFPEGMDIEARVSLFGVVYKRWAYNAEEGLTVAPVVMTNGMQWLNPPREKPSGELSSRPTLPWVIAMLVSSCVATWLVFRWTGQQGRAQADLNLPERIEIPSSESDAEKSHDNNRR